MPEMKTPALLVDCFTRGGLAVARSLARQGIPITVLACNADNLVFKSKYASDSVVVPSPENRPEAFVAAVVAVVHRIGRCVVIPITDQATMHLDRARAQFPANATLALSSTSAVGSVLDKAINLPLARKLSIPCPKSCDWKFGQSTQMLVDTLGLPLVIKNPFPESVEPERALPFRFRIIDSETELDRCLADIGDLQPHPLFQEYVSGTAVNICCFSINGEVLAIHQYVSRRRSAHAGILREIVPLKDDLAKYVRSMLGQLQWTGVAHLGFIVDEARDKVWYMETNGRFWASVQGSVHAGWDFPLWLYQFFAEGTRPVIGSIEVGSQTCYRPGDLQVLVSYLAGGRPPAFYSEPGKWRAIGQYLASFRPGVHSDVCDWRDPIPGFVDFWRVLRAIVKAAPRWLGLRRNETDQISPGPSARD